jgi:hypothetical protein
MQSIFRASGAPGRTRPARARLVPPAHRIGAARDVLAHRSIDRGGGAVCACRTGDRRVRTTTFVTQRIGRRAGYTALQKKHRGTQSRKVAAV